jgi:(p)ppGpp synthase/HD superfamily hydrolase
MTNKTYQDALQFATTAHEGQVRKYTGEAYITHPIAVANNVAIFYEQVFGIDAPQELVMAAVLHDVVEDSDVTIEEIDEMFGGEVAEYVWWLTKPPAFVGNRHARKALDRARLALAPPEVRLVKLNDILHNMRSINQYDENFGPDFRRESGALFVAMDILNLNVGGNDVYHYFREEMIELLGDD